MKVSYRTEAVFRAAECLRRVVKPAEDLAEVFREELEKGLERQKDGIAKLVELSAKSKDGELKQELLDLAKLIRNGMECHEDKPELIA